MVLSIKYISDIPFPESWMDGQSSSCVASFPPLVLTVSVDWWKGAAPAAWSSSVYPPPPESALPPQAPHADHSPPSAFRGHPHCRPWIRWAPAGGGFCSGLLCCSAVVFHFISPHFFTPKKSDMGRKRDIIFPVRPWSAFYCLFVILDQARLWSVTSFSAWHKYCIPVCLCFLPLSVKPALVCSWQL